MGRILKTGCVLCAQNCGLEVEVENNRIVKVRGDKDSYEERYRARVLRQLSQRAQKLGMTLVATEQPEPA